MAFNSQYKDYILLVSLIILSTYLSTLLKYVTGCIFVVQNGKGLPLPCEIDVIQPRKQHSMVILFILYIMGVLKR